MTSDLTALILTYNERENIARTLSALSFTKEIVLIDSDSSDETVELARHARPDVRVMQRAFSTHTQQWNFGLDQIATEWVLTLDADYELSPELQTEIAGLEPHPDVVGYSAAFEYRIFGHRLRASSYPARVVLFRVAKARYVDDGHTQTLWFYSASPASAGEGQLRPPAAPSPTEDGAMRRIEKLAGKIYHDDRKPLSHWIRAQDRYAILEAKHLLKMADGRWEMGDGPGNRQMSLQDRLRLKIFFAAPVMFLYLLFWRGLILDGWPGWFYVAERTVAELLLSMRLLTEREKLER